MTAQDQVFKEEIEKISDFKFGSAVADVFDDMVSRSVPCYNEIQRMIAELAADHAIPGTNVYDLGCATGATLIGMGATIPQSVQLVGIDDSPDMLDKCRAKLETSGNNRSFVLECADLNGEVQIENASVVVLCLTLQFVRPIYRAKLIKSLFDGMVSGGALILVEKILAENQRLNPDFIRHYYNYKRRNHYSDLEISQKREALENVLIPYKVSENIALLSEAGLTDAEIFFKWYNFCGLIAFKN